MIYDRLPFEEYIRNLWDSKISFSPFGMGEICFRDFECIQYGTIFIKPNQDIVKTTPNIYQAGKTYIDVEYDWSNLEERIDYILSNFKTINEMINTNVREKFIDGYDYNKLCLHWYNIFKNLNSVESD